MAVNTTRTSLENLKVLGLEGGATQAEIKKAYKQLALQYHPDKNLDDPEATGRFQELSKAYLALKPGVRDRQRYHHQCCCPTHGYWSYSDSEYSDDDYYTDDDECSSDEDSEVLYFYRKVFLDVFSEFVFRKRFYASRKRQKLSPEEEEEDQFFDFIHKKYREENEENEYELTEEDLRKFHSYDEWHKETSQKKRRNRKGRAGRRKVETIQQETTKPVSKKQQLAQQRKREQEMRKIGEELAKSVKTKTSMTNRKQEETQRGSISSDARVAQELRAQAEKKRQEEEKLKANLRLVDAEEKKKEKQNKRKEKKNQRKQNKLESLKRKADKENQGEENIFLERVKQMEQTSYNIPEYTMASEDLKKASKKNEQEMKTKSSLLVHHFGIQSSDPINKPSPTPSPPDSSSTSSLTSEPAQKSSAELLKRHMEIYEEMMKVQPRRHTEQQIKAERAKEREKLLQKQQEELERLRGEHRSQFDLRATKDDSNSENKFRDSSSFQAQRSEILQRQRELEKRRNEEEDIAVNTQKMYEIKRKKQEPKWYERENTGQKLPHNPMRRTAPDIWVPPPAPPKETVWVKRQQEQEKKQAVLQELEPMSEREEQEMLKRALEISEREAREEEERKRFNRERSSKLARSYELNNKPPGHENLPAHTCTMSKPQRPDPEEPYSSIWDIEDKKSEPPLGQSAPCPDPQRQGPTSYANITRQPKQSEPAPANIYRQPRQSVSAQAASNPPPVQRQRTPVSDTQMDLERAEMETHFVAAKDDWNLQNVNDSWKTSQETENAFTKTMPAYIRQTSETEFSVSGSSSSSLYSSMESLDSGNDNNSNSSKSQHNKNTSGITAQTDKTFGSQPANRGGFGIPKNQRTNINTESGQKPNKPVDNLSSKSSEVNRKGPARKTNDNTKNLNRGGFGQPSIKSGIRQLNNNQPDKHQDKHITMQPSQVYSQELLTPETENWNDEIEDFPSDIKQTYAYGVDHVKFPITKTRVVSEKELVTSHKRELHFKKSEPVPEEIDLDITPVDLRGLKSEEEVQNNWSKSALAPSSPIAPVIPRTTDVELGVSKVNAYQEIPNPKDSNSESNRRLPVLKGLSKTPERQKSQIAKEEMAMKNECNISCDNELDKNQLDGHPVNDQRSTEQGERLVIGHTKKEDNLKPYQPSVEIPQKLPAPDNKCVIPEQYMPHSDVEKPVEVIADTAPKTTPAPTTQGSATDMPAGLPPHLMQAYLHYLAQSAMDTTATRQNTGLVGGLLPGLGMPMVSPFMNPLYSPMMPFNMDPFAMNPLLALSLQSQQQQQLSGQLGVNQNNKNETTSIPGNTDSTVVHQANEVAQQTSRNNTAVGGEGNDGNGQVTLKSEHKVQENHAETIIPLVRNIDIQTNEAINRQSLQESRMDCNKLHEGQESSAKLEHSANQEKDSSRLPDLDRVIARPPGRSENCSAEDTENVRTRRPSKDQTASLRIPREPSVSSRLYGVQTSPLTDDPAVVRMSSAEISSIQASVEQNIKQIRATTLDEDPSVIRCEQKWGAITSQERANEPDANMPVNANEGFNQKSDMFRRWMNNGTSIRKTVQNNSGEGQAPCSSEDKQQVNKRLDPGSNQKSAVTSTSETTFSCQSYPNNRAMEGRHKNFDDRVPSNKVARGRGGFGVPSSVRGRGGFGSPSMPRTLPATTSDTSDTSFHRNQDQNPSRPSFNTKSLSERFSGIKQDGGDGFGDGQPPLGQRAGGDGFSARKLPPRLQAQREKNQQVKDMINQLRKETEASQQAQAAIEAKQRSY